MRFKRKIEQLSTSRLKEIAERNVRASRGILATFPVIIAVILLSTNTIVQYSACAIDAIATITLAILAVQYESIHQELDDRKRNLEK